METREDIIMRWRVTVPDSVALREFPTETVVLNLATGQYHGLNPVAARMLELFTKSPTVGAAVERLAEEFDRPPPVIRSDAAALCRALRDRQLISVESDGPPEVRQRHRLAAFGLDIDAAFAVPGLAARVGDRLMKPVTLDWIDESEIDHHWPASARRVVEERLDESDRAPARTIDYHPHAGYRLYARDFGIAWIAPGGEWVRCTRPPAELWSWQRFLGGRVLPWTAALRGLEPFHASAVSLQGRAVAFCGATGSGKSSLALHLLRQGAELITDDVLAVEARDAALICHAGASTLSLREPEWTWLADSAVQQLGTLIADGGKAVLSVERMAPAAPLDAIYFVAAGPGPLVEPMMPTPPILLSSTFVFGIQTPERLRRQLGVCAEIARRVSCFHLRPSGAGDAAAVAAAIVRHAMTTPRT